MKNLDLFSAPFIIRIDKNEKGHRTKCGGFVSLLIILTIITYFIYLQIEWITGNIPAKTDSVTLISQNGSQIPMNYMPLDMRLSDSWGNPVPTNILNIIGYIDDTNVVSTLKCFDQDGYKPQSENFRENSYCFKMQDNQLKTNQKFKVYVNKCSNATQNNCASSQQIDKYLSSNLISFSMVVYKEQFQLKDKGMIPLNQELSYFIRPGMVQFNQIKFLPEQLSFDSGLLLHSFKSFYTFSQISDSSTLLTREEFQNFVNTFTDNQQTLMYTDIKIHNQIKYTRVFSSKLTEIQAQIGGFVQIITIFALISLFSSKIAQYKLLSETLIKNVYRRADNSFHTAFNGFRGTFNLLTGLSQVKKKVKKLTATQEEKNLVIIYDKIEEQLELKAIISELQRIKFAICLLYTPQQWKMVTKYVGKRLPQSQNLDAESIQNLNHLELIEQIENLDEQQDLAQYLLYRQKEGTKSTLDDRINDCLLDENEVKFLYGQQAVDTNNQKNDSSYSVDDYLQQTRAVNELAHFTTERQQLNFHSDQEDGISDSLLNPATKQEETNKWQQKDL